MIPLSVVIPTRDRSRTLSRVLAALLPQASALGCEVVVVDDGSRPDAAALQQDLEGVPGLRLLRQPPRGPAAARNLGAFAAAGERLLFLGDDTIPQPGLLEAHLAGGTGAAVLGRTDWDASSVRVTPFLRYINEYGAQYGFSIIKDADDVPFCFFYTSNVSLPREDFVAHGGFDTAFSDAAWEDIEFAYRSMCLGQPGRPRLRLVYRPRALVLHDHPVDVASFERRQRRAGIAAAVFVRKHPELAAWLGVQEAVTAPPRRSAGGRLLALVVRAADALALPLPGRLYEHTLRWPYVDGLRAGLASAARPTPPRLEARSAASG